MNIKTLLGKNGGIVTDMRYLAVIVITCLLISCSQVNNGGNVNSWVEKALEVSRLQEIDQANIQANVIKSIQSDYRNNPIDSSYAEIELFKAYLDDSPDRTILLFDILYVDDVQVVYEIDSSGRILSKHMISSWN